MEINDNILFVNSIIDDAIRKNSSDIHIEPFEENVRIRFRINGSLVKYKTVDKSMHSKIITRIKIIKSIYKQKIPTALQLISFIFTPIICHLVCTNYNNILFVPSIVGAFHVRLFLLQSTPKSNLRFEQL